ncbi:coiled-coil domain-containing protein [Flavobacterium tructae]|uniref:Uncharacterized protein n=1 Tax=Flavobacterium tructae TaxID=1114873 RepID=A0A1S1J3Y0_9FLAO|nr:hypothetical protein [Flavobacterium tructae]OHT44448.1 hypothetical protein BHE19_12065 [Flavobacterium tructae]OXB19416.1 hypothetical protein B0A71_12805 [Flavobacterium tructae]
MEYLNEDLEEMEMPTPCQKCDNWFDLNNGVGSERWYPRTVICSECGEKEQNIIELESDIDDLQIELDEAEGDIVSANESITSANKVIADNRLKIEELKEKLKNLEDE